MQGRSSLGHDQSWSSAVRAVGATTQKAGFVVGARRLPRIRRTVIGLAFCAPAIVGLVAFSAYPVLSSLYYSFTDFNGISEPLWIGLDNYGLLLEDPVFWHALANTFYFAALALPTGIILAFCLASLLNLPLRGVAILRMTFFVPSIVPLVAASLIWLLMFNPQFGLINSTLGLLGIVGPGWLSDPSWSKPSLVILFLWGIGNTVLIFLAGLQDVPKDLYDAAAIDGASHAHRFRHITIPMMGPYLLFSIITGLVGTFQYFTQAHIMTQGGPADSTRLYSLYLYDNAFIFHKLGYASAMAWVLFMLVAVVSFILFRSAARHVYYGGE
jgi:multiple sugar transport system permease protein